jgi:hypothetical protein
MKNRYGEEQEDILGTVDPEMVQEQAIQNEIADELNYVGEIDEPEQINVSMLPPPNIQEQAPSSIPMPPVVEDDLQQAQDQRNKLQQFGLLMKAFQGASNIPRQMINPNAKADTSIQDQVIELASQPVNDVTNKRNVKALDQRLSSANIDLQNKALDNDPASDQSRSYQELLLKMIPSFDQERLKQMSARQIEAVMSPVARWQQFKDMASFRQQQLESLNEARKEQQIDKDLDREFKKESLQARKDEKDKQQTALKEAQAKANKAYEVGLLAEKQYLDAISDKKKYDPTSTTDVLSSRMMDNPLTRGYISPERKQAEAASDSWVDSFLRLDSGAAIGVEERSEFKRIYFPQPGDDEQTVKNKAKLRQTIKDAAKSSSGKFVTVSEAKALAGIPADSSNNEKTVVKKQYSASANKTKLIYSDGTKEVVDGRR